MGVDPTDRTRIRAPTYYYNFSNATRPGATQSNASKTFLIKTYQSTIGGSSTNGETISKGLTTRYSVKTLQYRCF